MGLKCISEVDYGSGKQVEEVVFSHPAGRKGFRGSGLEDRRSCTDREWAGYFPIAPIRPFHKPADGEARQVARQRTPAGCGSDYLPAAAAKSVAGRTVQTSRGNGKKKNKPFSDRREDSPAGPPVFPGSRIGRQDHRHRRTAYRSRFPGPGRHSPFSSYRLAEILEEG